MSAVYFGWLVKADVEPYFGTVQYFYKLVIFQNDDLESTGLENV